MGYLFKNYNCSSCNFFYKFLCHYFGKRPYDLFSSARDSWFVSLFTFGEGYHNYHHINFHLILEMVLVGLLLIQVNGLLVFFRFLRLLQI